MLVEKVKTIPVANGILKRNTGFFRYRCGIRGDIKDTVRL
jgi:hypothetical protein